MESIQQSVGRGGVNSAADARTIQRLVNANIARLTPLARLTVDGVVGPATISAIEAFQRRVVGMPNPDGRVDPGGRTLRALNDGTSSAGGAGPAPVTPKIKSGTYWVSWASVHAPNSKSVDDLVEPFRGNARAFIQALEAAGATVTVKATFRHTNCAYLFHWSWLIALSQCTPSTPPTRAGVDIEWDHGNLAASRAGAQNMVNGFALAVPPASTNAPALNSIHINGRAIDMKIKWNGTLHVAKKDGTVVAVPGGLTANANTQLHHVGASYGVKKLNSDEPHWSDNGT